MRLRTLPLSESGVLMGLFIASSTVKPGFLTVLLLLLTTALLQILSNLSNELGDTLHGTDTDQRQGMHYSIQEGEMTVTQMKRFIGCVFVLCCISGLAMIYSSFGTFLALEPVALIFLGAVAIWAAMHYTLGKNPYGYRGLGDLFVFLFFGLVSVCGSYYVCSHDLTNYTILLPASAIGCFSVGVLNVNNIRDMKTDINTRTTVAIRMGERGARIYHTVLLFLGWVLLVIFAIQRPFTVKEWLFVITLPLYAIHLKVVWTKKDKELDPMLPMLVISTFIMVLLFGLGQ